MRAREFLAAALFAFGTACGPTAPEPSNDGGPGSADAGAALSDAGPGSADAGAPRSDAGQLPDSGGIWDAADAAQIPVDASSPDGGAPGMDASGGADAAVRVDGGGLSDAGGTRPDASFAASDASSAGPDAASAGPDAAAAGPDAAAPGPDAGPVPSQPASLAAVAQTPTRVDLSWTQPGIPVTSTQVMRGVGAAVPSLLTTISGTGTAFSDTTATPSTSYTYQVVARNANGSSPPSGFASATTPASATSPAAPSGLAGQAVSSSEASLTWTDNSANETGFKVYRVGVAAPVATTSLNETTTRVTGLAASTTYQFQVSAFNGTGESARTTAVSVTTPAAPAVAPAAPSNLVATALTANSIKLTWSDNSNNETGFQIEMAVGAGGFAALPFSMQANATSVTLVQLAASTLHQFRIYAFANALKSAYSNTASATTPANPAPTNTATITVTEVPGMTSPLIGGTYTPRAFSPRPTGLFAHLDYPSYDQLVNWYADAGVQTTCVYPRQPYAAMSKFGTSWMLATCKRYSAVSGSQGNIVLVATFSSWSSVVRRQFVALHLRAAASGGGNVIYPESMWAGDLDNDAPLPLGASTQGVVLSSHLSGVTPYLSVTLDGGRLPTASNDPGFLRGSASGNLNFVTEWGTVYSSRVDFRFDVALHTDDFF